MLDLPRHELAAHACDLVLDVTYIRGEDLATHFLQNGYGLKPRHPAAAHPRLSGKRKGGK